MDSLVIEDMPLEGAMTQLCAVLECDSTQLGDTPAVFRLLDAITEDGEFVRVRPATEGLPRRGIIPGTRVHINVRKATITTLALLLDALKTRGIAIGALVSAGYEPKFISLLALDNGELCCFFSLKAIGRDELPLTANDLAHITVSNPCLHQHFNCIHMKNGICELSSTAAQSILSMLAKMKAIESGADGAVIEVR